MKINRPGKIVDINYLAVLPISELEIEASHIEGIEILNGKSSLTKLTLIDCGDTDFTKLGILPSLSELSLSGNFSSIEFTANYKNLEMLILECGCKSLTGIENLKKLSIIEIRGNHHFNSFQSIESILLKELKFFTFSFNSELLYSLFKTIESGAVKKVSIDKCYNLYNENNKNAYEFDISQSLISKFKNLKKVVDVYHHKDNYFGDSLEITCK
tara:strand:- start:232 stop:873 length:642 start_codon:yes stop_codon:yes gene_type:complete